MDRISIANLSKLAADATICIFNSGDCIAFNCDICHEEIDANSLVIRLYPQNVAALAIDLCEDCTREHTTILPPDPER